MIVEAFLEEGAVTEVVYLPCRWCDWGSGC